MPIEVALVSEGKKKPLVKGSDWCQRISGSRGGVEIITFYCKNNVSEASLSGGSFALLIEFLSCILPNMGPEMFPFCSDSASVWSEK